MARSVCPVVDCGSSLGNQWTEGVRERKQQKITIDSTLSALPLDIHDSIPGFHTEGQWSWTINTGSCMWSHVCMISHKQKYEKPSWHGACSILKATTVCAWNCFFTWAIVSTKCPVSLIGSALISCDLFSTSQRGRTEEWKTLVNSHVWKHYTTCWGLTQPVHGIFFKSV